ncbi:4-hydroxybenzoate 3-monooxygenase [Pseudoclavibacter endophyticus]|uniref:4-hydroxybenzoate 3-monooxygenase n=1 Tax=Pseudoclavibacter endophyticus TaxID=1778590 RepID=UPI001993C94F|nr:4-hydroxybenzoate 3-monooxygenase [Pseudoclavibacter endophyticus]GGA61259.1 4-hydroxybenzoate 3-monooxygenase [Pseudoclavibacter endophyticus]
MTNEAAGRPATAASRGTGARQVETTTVGIVGAGPAGLLLRHLLHRAGIATITIDNRTRQEIAETQRAGILEQGSVELLTETGAISRIRDNGYEHGGIYLRFDGENHHIDFTGLVNASVWLYPQNEVFVDLAETADRDGADVRYGVSDTEVDGWRGEHPVIRYTDADGVRREIRPDLLVGADGSRSVTRRSIPHEERSDHFIEYPFAWFGFLVDAPPSADELIYSTSEHGFVLISQRTETMQRMYFQCDPGENPDEWDDERIWAEMDRRLEGRDGFTLKKGPIHTKNVLPFRSFVCEPMRHGRLVLAGDAGHTVPPTGAKGLNLALNDVRVLAPAIERWVASGDDAELDVYSDAALQRVWRAQRFSYQMTTMLHTTADATPFERRRTLAELRDIVDSRHGQAALAEAYTGWPHLA